MTHTERYIEALERENARHRITILNQERELKLAHDLIKVLESNLKESQRREELLNKLQSKTAA